MLKENNTFQSRSRKANCLDHYLKKPVNEFIKNSFTGYFARNYVPVFVYCKFSDNDIK